MTLERTPAETPSAAPLRNWSGNVAFEAARVHRPTSVDEVREIVAGAQRVRALGSRHSFNRIADTPHDLVSMAGLDRVLGLDREARTVTVEGGIRYGELGRSLTGEGLALANMASLPHITVAGSVATGTHGSGVGNGGLATSVAGLAFVNPQGELVRIARGDPRFPGAAVAMGGLGPAVEVVLDVVPSFDIAQTVYEGLPFETALGAFDEIVSAGYSVSLFTHWKGRGFEQVWVKRLAGEPAPATFHGARAADGPRHPVPGMPTEPTTPQMGVPGPWNERLPHFRLEFTPSSGDEIQSEYLLARADAPEALRALDGVRELIAPLLQVCEVRTVAADDLWTSPAYGRETVGVHFTWLDDMPGVTRVLPEIEAALAPFGARPHWGKRFTMPGDAIRPLFPRMPEFRALLREYDPEGKFRNAFLDEILGGE